MPSPISAAESLIPFLHELADAAGEAILPHFRTGLSVTDKGAATTDGVFDPVTIADRNAETAMRELIARRFPEHGILGEEFGAENADAEWVWVLDPIDGTRAFISGLPLWGVLIGLRHQGVPTLGMVAQPYIGERFYGSAEGAWVERNGERRPIRTRACSGLAEATLSTTMPQLFVGDEQDRYRAVERSVRLTRYGYDCYAYAMVASGFIDCVIESGLKPYDIEPIIPVIRGAGGFVTDWAGQDKTGGGQVLAAGDRRVLDAALEMLGG
ncbi:myo-inositol-1(or 4)-monophosphatase [Faunimonas pinastri]|uniref:Histidinol-phosphatase n=1 Tax=Faunimonas pinastri TaxID=1855383 RepID=A0A1H9P5F3_9HYPH|nr:histidinol-phosphatase [Faunimonas pinastri]SER43321.1 myo-inositol-1(or 4)-monophosphatase [Faunimonas pinastri]